MLFRVGGILAGILLPLPLVSQQPSLCLAEPSPQGHRLPRGHAGLPNPSCRGTHGTARGCIFKPQLINFGGSSPSPAPSPLSKCQRQREAVRVMDELSLAAGAAGGLFTVPPFPRSADGVSWAQGREKSRPYKKPSPELALRQQGPCPCLLARRNFLRQIPQQL